MIARRLDTPRLCPKTLRDGFSRGRVERPRTDALPIAILKRLDPLSRGARLTYAALTHLGSNPHGAVFARRAAIAEKRSELGAPSTGNSHRTISEHLGRLLDAALLVRLTRRAERSDGKRTWYPLVLLLGYSPTVDSMVGLSVEVCMRLAWGAEGIRGAIEEGTLEVPPCIPGPLIDPKNRRRGRRPIRLDQCLPPLRRRTCNGIPYDNRARHEALLQEIRPGCLELLTPSLQVCRFLADQNSERVPSRSPDSAPPVAGCPSAPVGTDCTSEARNERNGQPLTAGRTLGTDCTSWTENASTNGSPLVSGSRSSEEGCASETANSSASGSASSHSSRQSPLRQSARERGTSRAPARKPPRPGRGGEQG